MTKMRNCIFIVLCLSALMAFGQPGNPIFGLTGSTTFDVDMRPIALMDIETSGSSSNLTITLSAPNEAGDPIGTNPLFTNSENWINYSCSNRDVSSRHIEVEISSGQVPDGFELRLDVATASGGGGTLGSPALGTLVLSSISQNIVTGIEGAFTGDSFGNGHQLTFSLHFLSGSYGSINNQNSGPIIISYTLVDD